jgi:LysM repeat protein
LIRQVKAKRSGAAIAGGVHANIQELVQLIIDEIERRGYLLHPGWNWGAECRAISGTNTPSNHSWGLAIDINAPNNPYTSSGQHDIPDWAFAIWRSYGFGVGADYSGKKDWMHTEFMGTPSDAAAMTALARRNLAGGISPPTIPTTPSAPTEEDEDMLKVIRNKQGVDYVYGPGFFDKIETVDEYFFYTAAKLIDTPHGQAPVSEQNLIDFIEVQVRKNQAAGVPSSGGTFPVPAPVATYTVVSGDTLSGIAAKTGKSVADLQAWNNITDPNSINVGQVLRLGPS